MSWGGASALVISGGLLMLAACANSRGIGAGLGSAAPPAADAGSKLGTAASHDSLPETGANAKTLIVTGVEPGSGPYAGGNIVVVRGSAFTDKALVFVGGNMVQPAATTLLDRTSLQIAVPAGRVGLADVMVQVDGVKASKADAYTYSPLLLDPVMGSIAGGTTVQLTVEGASFDGTETIMFGNKACTDLHVVTPSQVLCKTPAARVGMVDVTVAWPKGDPRAPLIARSAFAFADLTDTDRGGLSGGPITGTLNVTVVDATAGSPIPGAFVLIGDDPNSVLQGVTDAHGQITFSSSDLSGPVTIHAAAKCMERASIVAFNAQNVTVHMTALLDPTCGDPGTPPPAGRGSSGSLISGELIFSGPEEFGINSWEIVPKPRAHEVRAAYVFTTQLRATAPNPDPAANGTNARLTERDSPIGVHGYPYSIFARPAGLAVYALAGIESTDTGAFVPYAMGIARDVLTAPGQETTGIDIHVNIPLDRVLQVQLSALPKRGPTGPDRFRVRAFVDLGGQGVIVRAVAGHALDLVEKLTGSSLFPFYAQPAMVGALADGRYQLVAGWYTGDGSANPPYTEVRRLGVVQTPDPVQIDDLLSIPQVLAPKNGAAIPSDRVLRWQIAGPKPDMFVVEITGGDGQPAWTQVVPGNLSESTIPDLSGIGELQDIASGVITWSVRAIRVDDFVYDEFKYNLLSSRFWTHTSVDTFTMQR